MSVVPSRWSALALLAVTQFVLILDASIVGVALPSIGPDLGFAPEDLSWVANAYTLTFGGLLLLGGRVADLTGRRRVFALGLGLFTAASLAGALSVNATMLVLARAAQGAGAALVAPAALSLVMTIFEPGPDRNRALGVFGALAGAGGAAGSILGGVLTEWLGWQATLYVNVPVGAVVIALAPRLLPAGRDARQRARGFDLAGAVTVTAGLTLLVYALVDSADAGWGSPRTLGLCAAAAVLIAVFVAVEARSAHPLVPLRIFRRGTLRAANVLAALTTMAMFPMFFLMTFYLQQVLGYEPVRAGLGGLPVAVALAAAASVGSQLVTRFGYAVPLAAGLTLVAAGLGWFSRMSADGGFTTDVLGPSVVMGLGGGLAFVSVTIAATSGVRPEEAGLASGLINTAQQVGGSLGLALVVAAATARTQDVLAAGERVPVVALNEGYRLAMLIAAGIALAGALLAGLLVRAGTARAEQDAPRPIMV
ncbi:drug resistance transporter, EmrB/QacA subfamily [Thermomonospora echinospora]|uniref:Drug resistance transporter, EmrB/QacA subfamily n=1 Tax=Thermomonospora echinospora TaxID=1992 RepID=A0A1H6A259_9ACTN|nr:DHA2 family efflux MFS transporter permease subunit [Thermomonospora echinospora]SEG42294.1 drug resistance transporter, EmrB/QacA subfamily [Thermomonospora echinospora]